MRILISLTYYRPHYSGLTIYAEREARALAERGHQVCILTSQYNKKLPLKENMDGVEIIRSKVLFRLSKGVIMPWLPFQAAKLLTNSDVVQLHVPQFDAALIALIARIMRKPVVLTYHCDLKLPIGFTHSLASRSSNLLNHIAADISQSIVHNTRDYAENSPFLQRYLNKLVTIFPPINVPRVDNEEVNRFRLKFNLLPNQRIIGMAARLASEKGVDCLAKAVPKIVEKYPDTRILFVGPYQQVIGEEEYAANVMHLIEMLGSKWTFVDVLSPREMGAFYRICDVLVLPSINSTESFGMVQLESMSCGTPVIASDLPGVRIPVLETGMGILVSPTSVDELALAVIKILDNPQAYQSNPSNLLAQTSPEIVAEKYELLFKSLLQS